MTSTLQSGEATLVTEFIEQLGLLTEGAGMPRIAGRIVGLLLITDEPIDLEGIAERLQVSHGSASTNTRFLENLGVIERMTTPGDRRVRFRMANDLGSQFLERDLQRQQKIGALVRTTLEALPEKAPGRANLERMQVFNALAVRRTVEMLNEWADQLRQMQRTPARPTAGQS